jgi:hypothetical protein
VSDIKLSAASVQRYEKFEATFQIMGMSAENPFDPDEINVTGVIHTPSGRQVVVPAFYHQDFLRTRDGEGEKLTPVGKPAWKIRYAPVEHGEHTLTVEARMLGLYAESEAVPFRCAGGNKHGFLRVGGNRRAFEFDDGTPWFAVGENLCWGRSTFDYDHWIKSLSANGGNYARLWLGPFDLFTLEKAGSIGRYDAANAWRLDYVTDLATRHGIQLQFCLESFNSLRASAPNEFWHKYPYNALNGGPCDNPEDFFPSQEARKLFRNRLRYIVARWGYSAHVLAWEFWNEVDIIEKFVPHEVRQWHIDMAKYLREIDPNRHMLTTSFASSDGDSRIDSLPEMDFMQTHHYGAGDVAAALSAFCLNKALRFGKPHLVGEFGLDGGGTGDRADLTGQHLKEGLWSSTLSLSAGGAMIWWWDNYVEPKQLYHHFAPLARFVADVPWNKRDLRPVAAEIVYAEPQVRPFDFTVEGTQGAWQEHISNTPQELTVLRDGTVVNGENLSMYLHGYGNHPAFHNPVTFVTESDEPWLLGVTLDGVSPYGGARLLAYLDDELVYCFEFPGRAGSKDTIHEYDGVYVVPVPAGKHRVWIENDGGDWLQCKYSFNGYGRKQIPALRTYGVQDDTQALLWLQSQFARYDPKNFDPPQRVQHCQLVVRGLCDSAYKVEWWDTAKGPVHPAKRAQSLNGELTIAVPTVLTDIAVKITRER